jgi:hypothetical protein
LEHFEKPELFDLLDTMHRALLPGGRLLIRVPNGEGVFGAGVRYGDLTHELCFTQKSIHQTLAAAGFTSIRAFEIRPTVHGPVSLARRVVWDVGTLPFRLLAASEHGSFATILSANLLATAERGA